MRKSYSLPLVVFGLCLLEGWVIYLNLVVHPDNQPALTLVIAILFAIAAGIGMWYRTRVLNTPVS